MSSKNFILVAGFLFFVVFFSAQAQVSTIPSSLEEMEDSIDYQKEKEKMKLFESIYDAKILMWPYDYDDVSGFKMVFLKTNECKVKNANAVEYVVLVDSNLNVRYVVEGLLRHDRNLNEEESKLFGIYVCCNQGEGELLLSESDKLALFRLIFQYDESPIYLNYSKVKFSVAGVPELIPFTPITEHKRKKYQRFFGK